MNDLRFSPALLVALLLPSLAAAQYYQQPYYYPQQPYQYPPGHYQQPRQPRQQQRHYQQQPAEQRPRQDQAEKPAARRVKDNSQDSPPAAEVSAITGPFQSYTWSFSDTLSDLGRACGLSANEILALNNLSYSQLEEGQVLKIPRVTTSTDTLDIKLGKQQQLKREVTQGIRGQKQIALTFDAGGETDGYQDLLQNLKSAGVAATFFVTGEFAEKNPKVVREISDAGFPIHNHSYSHPEFPKISDEEMKRQLTRTEDIITSITRKSTKPYWRPPFGERDSHSLSVAAEAGYKSIYWTLDSLDSVDEKKSPDFLLQRIKSPPKARANPAHFLDGGIILMHVGEPTTAQAVPRIIDWLKQQGFHFVTVDDLLTP